MSVPEPPDGGVRAPEAPDVLDSREAGGMVVRGAAIRGGGFVGGILFSILGVALLTRHLGEVDYGRYQTVVALLAIVQSVTDVGMGALGMREYTQRRGADRDGFMRTLLGLRMVLTLAGVGLATAVAVLLGYDAEMIAGAALMAAGLLLIVLQGTVQIPLGADLRLGTVTAIDVGRQVLTTLLIVSFVALSAGLVPFFAVTIPVNLLLLGITVLLVRHRIPLRPSFDASAWGALVRPSIAFALATAVGTIYLYTSVIITELVASGTETGYFGAAFRVFVIVAAVPGVLATGAFPVVARAARDDVERLVYAVQRLFEASALLGGAAALGCVLGAGPVIEVVAGADFAPAAPVLRLLSIALLSSFVLSTWGFTLLALHQHRPMVVVNLVALVLSSVGVVVFAASSGARGAALGPILGETAIGIGYVLALRRHDPRLVPKLGRLARALPGTVLALALILVPGLPDAVQAVLGLAIYAALAFALGAVPPEVMAALRERRR